MNFKPLTIETKNIFDKYTKPYQYKTCEYSFINLFIWRIACNTEYCILDDALIIKKTDMGETPHFIAPMGYKKENLKNIINKLMDHAKENNFPFILKYIEDDFLNSLEELFKDNLEIENDRNKSDYIYESNKLISLSGKNLHGKKNHYNNFIKNNNYRIESINKNNINKCIEISIKWCNDNKCDGYLLYELKAIEELLLNEDKLDIIGMVVYVDDELSAFTLGERINEEMAIIHVEKATADINGLYTFINKSFIENYFSDIPFINREEDLGVEGLRHAKLSYHPIRLESKYKVIIKNTCI